MAAPTTQNPAGIGASAHFVAYAGAVADTDLVAEGGGAACRRIRCTGAGNLVVRRASDGALVTVPFLAGETQEISANALVAASSTATGVVAYW